MGEVAAGARSGSWHRGTTDTIDDSNCVQPDEPSRTRRHYRLPSHHGVMSRLVTATLVPMETIRMALTQPRSSRRNGLRRTSLSYRINLRLRSKACRWLWNIGRPHLFLHGNICRLQRRPDWPIVTSQLAKCERHAGALASFFLRPSEIKPWASISVHSVME